MGAKYESILNLLKNFEVVSKILINVAIVVFFVISIGNFNFLYKYMIHERIEWSKNIPVLDMVDKNNYYEFTIPKGSIKINKIIFYFDNIDPIELRNNKLAKSEFFHILNKINAFKNTGILKINFHVELWTSLGKIPDWVNEYELLLNIKDKGEYNVENFNINLFGLPFPWSLFSRSNNSQ